jgi:two-component system, response regulator PdtaR
MSSKILVVEDEILVAMEFENLLHDLGHQSVGIASDSRRAMELAGDAEVAFVDLNLVDGATGVELGRALAGRGVTVVYMTANPEQLGRGVAGTIGVISKPVDHSELSQVVDYAIAVRRSAETTTRPPRRLKLFSALGQSPVIA